MVVDERSRFREDNFQAAIAALTDGAEAEGKVAKGAHFQPSSSELSPMEPNAFAITCLTVCTCGRSSGGGGEITSNTKRYVL